MQSKFACLLVLGANAEFADNHAEMRRMLARQRASYAVSSAVVVESLSGSLDE